MRNQIRVKKILTPGRNIEQLLRKCSPVTASDKKLADSKSRQVKNASGSDRQACVFNFKNRFIS